MSHLRPKVNVDYTLVKVRYVRKSTKGGCYVFTLVTLLGCSVTLWRYVVALRCGVTLWRYVALRCSVTL